MTREEFYKLTDILNSEVLGNFMHGGEADELIAMFEEAVEYSNILEQEEPVSERNELMSRKEDCLGCDRRRLEIVTFKKTDGESVDIYMCRGLLDTPCPKGHG